MPNKKLTISIAAEQAGVNIETIRYYQRIGLIDEPAKPVSGYRLYTDEVIMRIRFIKRAQQLGFRLQEISELMELNDGQCEDVRTRAEQKRRQINQQITDLKNLRTTLDELIETCHSDGGSGHCPIIENLAGYK